MKIKKTIISILTFLLTFSGQVLVLTTVHAQSQPDAIDVCVYLNNQTASQNGTPSTPAPAGLKGKFFTITEEPLGQDKSGFSYRCARETDCNYALNDQGAVAVKDKCSVSYTTISSCNPTSKSDQDTIKQNGGQITSCEIVQVYISGSGTDLLYSYIGQIYRYVAEIGGLIAVFIMIFSGIQIASAGSNTEVLNKSKARITRSILGLILLFLSAVILYAINPNFFVI